LNLTIEGYTPTDYSAIDWATKRQIKLRTPACNEIQKFSQNINFWKKCDQIDWLVAGAGFTHSPTIEKGI
jgi:3-methyladenine DNA glycosylase AlkD